MGLYLRRLWINWCFSSVSLCLVSMWVKCLDSFFYFWNTVLILSDSKKVNGLFEWGNVLMTQGAWLWLRSGLRYSMTEVPNPRATNRYRSVGHLIPGRTERINNLHYFSFIYYLSLNDVLFWKMTRFSPLHLSMTHSWRMSRRLSWSRDTLPLKLAHP